MSRLLQFLRTHLWRPFLSRVVDACWIQYSFNLGKYPSLVKHILQKHTCTCLCKLASKFCVTLDIPFKWTGMFGNKIYIVGVIYMYWINLSDKSSPEQSTLRTGTYDGIASVVWYYSVSFVKIVPHYPTAACIITWLYHGNKTCSSTLLMNALIHVSITHT